MIEQQLLEMGFNPEKMYCDLLSLICSKIALAKTSGDSLEQAVQWLFQEQEKEESPEVFNEEAKEETKPEGASSVQEETPNSLRCDDCGKLFQTAEQAEFHAFKSKHSNFSESTDKVVPLTAEEKEEKLLKLKEKLTEKRKQREMLEKEEQKENERIRRLAGKELADWKKANEEKKAKEAAQERLREKQEEKAAKARVKALIEADRLERMKKKTPPAPVEVSSTIPVISNAGNASGNARIQIRFKDGVPNLTLVLSSSTTYNELFRLASEHVTSHGKPVPASLMTTMPRKAYSLQEHGAQSLSELGFLPSILLMQP